MFKAFILSESLGNPIILNDYKNIYVKIEKHPESKEFPFWHLFKIEIADDKIETAVEKFAKNIKYGWYAHFWNEKIVYICFLNKIFKIPLEKEWSSKEFKKVKEYAIKNGVAERYLDFKIED